ncbi:MAG: DUF1501 domain-containing protein [Candidatus Hydrogenedentes bacterium]|nr:DUF1501 domain-containing protein [Candidatus Hydrogenedentota bacterium]
MTPGQFLGIQSRREFFRSCAGGIGTPALWRLLALEGRSAGAAGALPQIAPRAKNIIFLFMAGAPSQLDLLDPKPKMQHYHGQPVPASLLEGLNDPVIKNSATVMASPRTFQRAGQAGIEFSDFLPWTATVADELCVVRSMHTNVNEHHSAQLLMNCGVPVLGHPCMGSWVTYGLGSESQNLPGFVVLTSSSGKGIDGGSSLWSNGFLPSEYRGVTFRSTGDPVLYLSNPPGITSGSQRARLDTIRDLNELHAEQTADFEIASRIAAYELAFRMQVAAPELLDFTKESAETLALYGVDQEKTRPFGANCLLARRMVERGVRFVQLYHSTWDDHAELNQNLQLNCEMTDKPTAALVMDLKRRGLLDETLIVWGGEFGRTPMNEVRRGNVAGKEGRDHHSYAFTMWLAGGGIRGGQVVGETDDFGYHITRDPIHVHDLQATLLHCLGVDHTRLTYRHQGRDFRLTDVEGVVVDKLMA